MKQKRIVEYLVAGAVSYFALGGYSGVLADAQCSVSNEPFSRGYCSLDRGPQGQWARGSVRVFSDGRVIVLQGLETDNLIHGACGWVEFELLDASGATVAYGYNDKHCIGPKPPGQAKIFNFPPVQQNISPDIAAQVRQIKVRAVFTADSFRPFGLTSQGIGEVLKIFMGAR